MLLFRNYLLPEEGGSFFIGSTHFIRIKHAPSQTKHVLFIPSTAHEVPFVSTRVPSTQP